MKFDTVIFGKFALDKTPTGKTSFEMRAFIISSVKCRTEIKCTCTANPNRTISSNFVPNQTAGRTADQPYNLLEIRALIIAVRTSVRTAFNAAVHTSKSVPICSAVHSLYSSICVQHLIRPSTSRTVQTWPYFLLEIRANKCSRTQH